MVTLALALARDDSEVARLVARALCALPAPSKHKEAILVEWKSEGAPSWRGERARLPLHGPRLAHPGRVLP